MKKCPTCCEETLEPIAVCFTRPNTLQKWCSTCGTLQADDDVKIPTRSPFAQSIAPFDPGQLKRPPTFHTVLPNGAIPGLGIDRPKLAAGLLLIAADAVARANKKIVDQSSPLFVLEDVLEALAAMIEELNAQGEDFAEILTAPPEQLTEIVRRVIERKKTGT